MPAKRHMAYGCIWWFVQAKSSFRRCYQLQRHPFAMVEVEEIIRRKSVGRIIGKISFRSGVQVAVLFSMEVV